MPRSVLDDALATYISGHYASSKSAGNVFCSASPITVQQDQPASGADTQSVAEQPRGEPEAASDATTSAVAEPTTTTADAEPERPLVEQESKEQDEPGVVAAVETALEEKVEGVKDAIEHVKDSMNESSEAKAEEKEEQKERVEEEVKEEEELKDSLPDPGLVDSTDKTSESQNKVETVEEPEQDPYYTLCIVGNKYNTSNFW